MKLVHFIYTFLSLFFIGCTKDKVSKVPELPSLTKYELIEGTYKVFDTLGTYLYQMEIEHIMGKDSSGKDTDSLRFNNLDNNFTVTECQTSGNNACCIDFQIGLYMPIEDQNHKRWRIMGLNMYYFENDTIQLKFDKCNILYYIEDCTPYFCEVVHQVAVKQH